MHRDENDLKIQLSTMLLKIRRIMEENQERKDKGKYL
jgi:hypothetical protein